MPQRGHRTESLDWCYPASGIIWWWNVLKKGTSSFYLIRNKKSQQLLSNSPNQYFSLLISYHFKWPHCSSKSPMKHQIQRGPTDIFIFLLLKSFIMHCSNNISSCGIVIELQVRKRDKLALNNLQKSNRNGRVFNKKKNCQNAGNDIRYYLVSTIIEAASSKSLDWWSVL